MMQNEDKITIILSSLTASYSLIDFKTILDIVLIILSIVNLLVIIGVKVYKAIKEKRFNADDTLKDAKALKEKYEELKKKLEGDENVK